MPKIIVNFEPFDDDETNLDERIIAFHNGLPISHPFSDYRGGLISITFLPGNRIEVELYALSESVAVRVPEKALVLEPPMESYWVHVEGGAWLVLYDRVLGFVDYSWLNPNLVELIGEVANVSRRKLRWVGDVDARAEYSERLALQSGVSERDILQQLLANGRLKR